MIPVIGEGGENDPRSLPLATRRRTRVINLMRPESPPEGLRHSARALGEQFPNARLRSITAVYNCMGLVFASRRTWVDTEHLRTFLTEDDYRKLSGLHEAEVGDLVVYRSENDYDDVTHVALVAEITHNLEVGRRTIRVLSKWGQCGEYLHALDNVPLLLGRPAEFWTDRKQVP